MCEVGLGNRWPGRYRFVPVFSMILAIAAPVPSMARPAPAGKEFTQVMFAGSGLPDDSFEYIYGEILRFLRQRNVSLKNDPDDNQPYRMNFTSRSYFLRNLEVLESGSLLYLKIEMPESRPDQMNLACFDAAGQLKWEKTVKGTLSMKYRKAVDGLVKKIKKKLEAHIGGGCLPLQDSFKK